MNERHFDLIILGNGPSASCVATICANAGKHVAVIEKNELGGTCALRGCNPKEVLKRAAQLVDRAAVTRGHGTSLENCKIDWQQLIDLKRKLTQPVPEGSRDMYQRLGIEVYIGSPAFVGRQSIDVEGDRLRGEQLLNAVGASAAKLPCDGAELLMESSERLETDQVPKRSVFVGGGYVSFEFAHVVARVGCECTMVEQGRPLAKFDQELVDQLATRTRQLGIDVLTQTRVEKVRREADRSFAIELSD